MKHTKGPWEVRKRYSGMPEVVNEQGKLLTMVVGIPEAEVNARLMAKAPEMLKALQELMQPSWHHTTIQGITLRKSVLQLLRELEADDAEG